MKVFIDSQPLSSGHTVRGVGTYTRGLISALQKNKEIQIVSDRKQADIIHYPYFDLFFPTLTVDQNIPTVVTIHDVIPLIYPIQYPSGFKGKINFLRQMIFIMEL